MALSRSGLLPFAFAVAACGSSNTDFMQTGAGSGGGAGQSGAGGAGTAGTSPGGAGLGGVAGAGAVAGLGGAAGFDTGAVGGGAGIAGAAGAGAAGAPVMEPPPGSYGTRSMLPVANSEMAVAETNGKIYVLGGYPATGEAQSTVQVYDVATDAWSLAAPLPVALHHPVAVGVNGKIYSLGGQIGRAATVDTDRTVVLDPAANQWTDLASMPTPRGAGAAAVIDDKIYVVGGRPPAGNAFEVYDISDNQWMELPNLPTALNQRNHIAASAIGGKVYVAGGRYNGGSFSSPMTASVDVFDPVQNAWSLAQALPRPRGGVNGIAAFGCFHVWGGEGTNTGEPNNVFPDHDVYDPRTNTWTSLPALPTPIHGVTGAAFVGGLIYMPGGGTTQGGSSGSQLFQVYRPAMSCE